MAIESEIIKELAYKEIVASSAYSLQTTSEGLQLFENNVQMSFVPSGGITSFVEEPDSFLLTHVNGKTSRLDKVPEVDLGYPANTRLGFVAFGRSGIDNGAGAAPIYPNRICENFNMVGWLNCDNTNPAFDFSSYTGFSVSTDKANPSRQFAGQDQGMPVFGVPMALHQLTRGKHPIDMVVISKSGSSMAGIFGPTTNYWQSFISWLDKWVELCVAEGSTPIIPAIHFSHQYGNSNYEADFVGYYQQVKDAIKTRTGQTIDPVWFVESGDQINQSAIDHVRLSARSDVEFISVYARGSVPKYRRQYGNAHFLRSGYLQHIESMRLAAVEYYSTGVYDKAFTIYSAADQGNGIWHIGLGGLGRGNSTTEIFNYNILVPPVTGVFLVNSTGKYEATSISVVNNNTIAADFSSATFANDGSDKIGLGNVAYNSAGAPTWAGTNGSVRTHCPIALTLGNNHLAHAIEGNDYLTGQQAPESLKVKSHVLVNQISV